MAHTQTSKPTLSLHPQRIERRAETGRRFADKTELWDAGDVARFLKVSRSWVYHRVEANLLPHFRIGALVRFNPALIKALAQGK